MVAAHGYTAYYLNILAGSDQSLASADDPAYAWIKDTWKTMDARLPIVTLAMNQMTQGVKMTEYKSKLHQTVSTTATDYWNDSCSIEELTYAIDNGAVGATTNPTIVVNVLKKEMHLWDEPHSPDHRREPDLVRSGSHLETDRGNGCTRRRAAQTGL